MKLWNDFRNRLVSDKKILLLLAVFMIGIFLFAVSGAREGRSKSENSDTVAECASLEKSLETRAERLLSGVKGVGKVRVLITVDRTAYYEYAKNTSDAGADGRRESDYVIVEKNGEKTGLAVYVAAPQVRGVAVSCEGGGSARVRQEVVELLAAAFGIGASRIRVSELAK